KALVSPLGLFYRYGVTGPSTEATEAFLKTTVIRQLLFNAIRCHGTCGNADLFSAFDTEFEVALQSAQWQRRFEQPIRTELDIWSLLCSGDGSLPKCSGQWPMWNPAACAMVVLYETYILHCELCQVPPANCDVPGCHDI